MNKFIVHHRSSHHANNSGYGQLIRYLDNPKVIYGKINFPYKISKFISRHVSDNAGHYDSVSFLKEIELSKILFNNEKKIVHYLNAERDVRFLVKQNDFFKNTFFLGTFHKPPKILEEKITNIKYLKNLNGAICVGANQVDFIKNWLDLEHVVYIPHGIDTQFFKPIGSRVFKQEKKLLFVGQHLRDFDMLNKVIPVVLSKNSNISLDVIIRKDFADKIKPHKNILVHHGVNDEQLRVFYDQADLLFLPLLDATACNSILEALSSGLPIVTSQVGGNFKYLEGTNNVLCKPDDVDAFIEESLSFIDDEDRLLNASKASRKKALEYDWKNISSQITQFYNLFS